MYGEVRTDFKLIEKMFNLLPKNLLENPHLTWCDPCCGNGYFSIYLYHQLFKNLTEIKELQKRHHRIMQMLTMIELNPFHIPVLKNIFGVLIGFIWICWRLQAMPSLKVMALLSILLD